MNVGSHLSKRAELNPGVEALVDEAAGRRFTFGGLWTCLPPSSEDFPKCANRTFPSY